MFGVATRSPGKTYGNVVHRARSDSRDWRCFFPGVANDLDAGGRGGDCGAGGDWCDGCCAA